VARPIAVALTGGIGAGKSEALRAFERRGAAVLSSDEVVHRLISEDAEVRSALEKRFGTTDRARIAAVVFSSSADLDWLERILHPRVRRRVDEWLAGLADFVDVAVVEIPLLYETGGEGRFDAVVAVTAPEAVRVERVGDRVRERSSRLLPDEEKVRRADFAYVNDGTLADLDRFVATVLDALRR